MAREDNVDSFSVFQAEEIAQELRRKILEAAFRGGGGHVGGALSVLDLLVALYGGILRYRADDPAWEGRDRLIFSKGHAVLALYACLEKWGMLDTGELDQYLVDNSRLPGHSEHVHIQQIEVTTGSLGHGPAIAVGVAHALSLKKNNAHVYVIVGDGECNEGSVWEACLIATQLALSNLTLIVDNNGMESLDKTNNILSVEPLSEKFLSFGFEVTNVNGHDFNELLRVLPPKRTQRSPRAVVANTIKGKGVTFAEGVAKWHFRQPSNEELSQALLELGLDAQISS